MSAATVIEKIEEKAAAEAAEIRRAAEARAKQAAAAILRAAEERAAEIRSSAEQQATLLLSAGRQQDHLETKISGLREKRRLLTALRQEAAAQLRGYPEEQTVSLLTRLVAEVPMHGAVRVGVSPADAALLAQRGVPAAWNGAATYTLSPEEAIKGGVILYGPEYDVDLTYEALIAAVFESHEKEIAECLFRSGS